MKAFIISTFAYSSKGPVGGVVEVEAVGRAAVVGREDDNAIV
jgi:hypothetical protein